MGVDTKPITIDNRFTSFIALLMMVSMIGPFANHIIVPSLPNLQQDFSTDYATVQSLVSLFIIAFGGSQLFVGVLADAYGRRPIMLAGLFIFAIASIACCFTTDIQALIFWRIVQGGTGSIGIVLSRAIVRDISADGQMTAPLGYLAMGTSIAPLLAPTVGGLLYLQYGATGPFWFLAIASVLIVAYAYVKIPETSNPKGNLQFNKLLTDIASLLRHSKFLVNTANIGFNTALFFTFVIGASYISSHVLNLSPAVYGLWFMLAAIGYTIGNFSAGKVANLRKFRPETVVLAGACTVLISMVACYALFSAGFTSVAVLFLPAMLAQFSSGFIMPNSLSSILAENPDKAGSASGLAGFLQFVLAAFFSSVSGFLVEIKVEYMLLLLVGLAIAGLASAIAAYKMQKNS